MNDFDQFIFRHDYTHCLDASDDCPDGCFRKEISFEIKERVAKGHATKILIPYANLLGTSMCPREENG